MKVYDRVKSILERVPLARSSDHVLIWEYWKETGLIISDLLERVKFMRATSPESITRARRKCQELYPWLQAPVAVQEARKVKEGQNGLFIFDEE